MSKLGLGQRGFYFGLGLAVGLGLAAHGAAASTVSTACRSGGVSKPPVAVAHPARQAQLFVSGQHRWWLTLQRVAVVPQLQGEFETSHAHGKYVVVFMTAQNLGKGPQSLFLDQDFAVLDAQGRQFGRANASTLTDAEQQYGRDDSSADVQPTFSARVVFVFDVASDAHGLTMVNAPSFGGSTQKLFTLGM